MKYSDEQVLETLRQDPIADAEKIVGHSWKEAPDGLKGVGGLGLLLQMRKSEALNTMLESRGDTTFSMKIAKYQEIIERYGFEKVYSETFSSPVYGDEKPVEETFYIYFKLPGVLLIFDTYRGNINGGKVYYSWVPNPDYGPETWQDQVTSSGGYDCIDEETRKAMDACRDERQSMKWDTPEYEDSIKRENEQCRQFYKTGKIIWTGDHDCREALILNLTRLEQNGKFVAWGKPPFVWALHHADIKREDYNYKELTLKRMLACPAFVQKAVNLDHEEWHREPPMWGKGNE